MTRRPLPHVLIGVTCVAVLSGCGGGDGGPHLGEIARLTPEGADHGVVATRNGNAVVAAIQDTGPASISLRTRRGPGEWSAPEPVAEPGFQVMSITPGLDDAGRPTVAWVVRNRSTTASQISARGADGAWPAPTSIPPIARSPFATFDLGVTGRGDAVAVWDPSAGLPGEAITATVRTPDGSWERTRVLERTPAVRLQTGSVVVPHSASVTAVWMQTTAGTVLRSTLRAASWDVDGGWRPTRTLPTTGRIMGFADAGPLPAGRTLIAWTALREGVQRLDLAVLGTGGTFTRVGAVPLGQEQSSNTPALATAPDGSAAVLVPRWTGGDAPAELTLVRIDADGRLGPSRVLDRQPVPPPERDSRQGRSPRFWGADLALAEDGTVTVAWLRTPATAGPGRRTTTMTVATIAPDGRIESSETVNDADGAGIDRARVDQLERDVALVSWWRLGRDGRIAGTYGVEVSR